MLEQQIQNERMQLRIPESLKTALRASARTSGRSLNAEIVDRLAASVGGVAQPEGSVEGALAARLSRVEAELARTVRMVEELRSSVRSAAPAGEGRHAEILDDDLRRAVLAAEGQVGSLSVVERKLFSTDYGATVRFIVSSPFQGNVGRGYVRISPDHFNADWLFLSVRGTTKGWMIPMANVRRILENVPVPKRASGQDGWDPKFGDRFGREVFWAHRGEELAIGEFAIDMEDAQ